MSFINSRKICPFKEDRELNSNVDNLKNQILYNRQNEV